MRWGSAHAVGVAAVLLLAACTENVEGRGGGSVAPDALVSSLELAPGGPFVANGVDAVEAIVTVRDAVGNPLAGHLVQLTATGSGNLLTQPLGPTGVDGVATGSLASTVAETKTVGAIVDPGPDEVTLADQPTVDFVSDPAVSASVSSVTVSSAGPVLANGIEEVDVVVTVRNAAGEPLAGHVVLILVSGAGSLVTQPVGPTGPDGVATATLAATVAGTKGIQAVVDPGPGGLGLADQPTVGFVQDLAVHAGVSSVTVSTGGPVIANGTETVDVVVTVRNGVGDPLAGHVVQLAATGSGNTLTQPVGPTGPDGTATGTLVSTVAEFKTLSALVDPGPGEVPLADQPTVEFVQDPAVSASASSVTVSTAGPVVANGVVVADVVVTVRNAAGEPLAGHVVQLAATGSGNALVQPVGTTGANGEATGTLASTVAEIKTLSALVDPGPGEVALADQPTVEFVGDPDAISATLSTVTVAPASHVAADGLEQAQVVVTVRDVNANSVPGVDVALAATGSGNALTPPPGVTGSDGRAQGALASTAAELKILSAIARPGPGQVALADRPTVGFVWLQPLTYYVRQSGQDPADCSGGTTPATAWRTLSKAAACAPAGATIVVGAGTYSESVHLTASGTALSPLRLVGDVAGARTGDAGQVVVDALGAPIGVHLDGVSWFELEGLTVRGALEGLRVEGGGDLELRDVVVHDCTTGILVAGAARVTIEHARVSNNLGQGVVLEGASDATLFDSVVYNNAAEGVVAALGTSNALVRACTLYVNVGDQVQVDASGVSLSVRDSLIVLGGADGLEVAAGSTLASDHNDVWGNTGLAYSGLAAGPGDLALDPHLVDPPGPDGTLGGAAGGDDSFHLSVPLASPAFDAGAEPAAAVLDSLGLSLAHRTSRVDGVPDGSAPDGDIANLGFHYELAGTALAGLASGDARAVYSEGTLREVRERLWDASGSSWSPESLAPPTEPVVRWVRHAHSPLATEEELLGLLGGSAAGTQLDVLAWTGAVWERLFSSSAIAGSNLDRRGFDLVYEATSGDALVVYSVDGDTPAYRARSAGVWSDELLLPLNDGAGPDPETNTGVVQWVELAARPGSDEVALAFADANADLVVLVWDGDQWLRSSASVPCVDLTLLSGQVRNRTFDLDWEGTSGDLVVAWGRGATNGFWWAERPAAGGGLGAAAHVAGAPGYSPNTVDLASESASDRIALVAYDLDARERLGLATWDGAAWLDAGEYDSIPAGLASTGAGDLSAAVAWVGTTGVALSVYPDTAAGKLDWARWDAGGGWVPQPPVNVAGKADTGSVRLLQAPGVDRVLALVSDSAGRLWAAVFDGATWSVNTPELEPTLSSSASVPFAGILRN